MCVSLRESPGTVPGAFVGLWSLLWMHFDSRRNEADEAPGALPKLANLPPNIDYPKLHPQMKGASPVFSPDNKPGNLKKPGGILQGRFWSFWAAAKTLCGLTMKGRDGGRDRVRVGGLCLLSSFICVTVFLIDYTPIVSFIFLSNRRLFLRGGSGRAAPPPIPPPPPILFLHQPTLLSPDGICCPHICIVCQSCTPTPEPLFEQTRTHRAHKNSPKSLDIIDGFADIWDSYHLWLKLDFSQ